MAKVIGSRAQVFHNTASHTSGGLTKDDLMKNKRGRIVSKKRHALGQKAIKHLEKSGHKGVLPKNRKMKGGSLGNDVSAALGNPSLGAIVKQAEGIIKQDNIGKKHWEKSGNDPARWDMMSPEQQMSYIKANQL